MKCLECGDDLSENHPPGYCSKCFMKKIKELQEWITEHTTVNRDTSGILISVAAKTAAYIDTEFEQFNLLVHMRWFLENYRMVWEQAGIHIHYKGEEFEISEISIDAAMPEKGNEAEAFFGTDDEEYKGLMFG